MTNHLFFGSITDSNKWLYHYTSKETALEHILSSGKIRLNSFINLNDPRESKDWAFGLSVSDKEDFEPKCFLEMQTKITDYVKNRSKVLCMVQDDPRALINGPHYSFHRGFSRPRMWAQYSNNHSGVCLIFDRESLEASIKKELSSLGEIYFGEVQYVNLHHDEVDAFHLNYSDILSSSLEETLDLKESKYYRNFFFSKLEDWSSENEWRCVLRGDNPNPEYVNIADSLRGIVIGSDFSDVYEPSVIPFGEMYSVEISRIMWINGRPVIVPGPQDNA